MCAVTLCGCSLFEESDATANVVLPGEFQTNRPSSTSTTAKNEGQFDSFLRPSSSSTSSSTSSPAVNVPDNTDEEPSDTSYRGKWYYSTLSDKCKAVYRRLYNCVSDGGEGCEVSDLYVTDQEVYEAFWAFDYDNGQFPALGDGYEINYIDHRVSNKVKSIKISYGRLPSENLTNALETRAEPILAAARELDTDYERLKYIHDWLVENTIYSNTDQEYESEADGPIVYGQALCEGYSKAFMYLAQSLGYPSVCVVGVANLDDHMWNMVKIRNNWYNVDVTWDDPDNPTDDNDGTDLRHDYFLICDAEIRLDHRVIRPNMMPTSPYGYFFHGYDQDSVN